MVRTTLQLLLLARIQYRRYTNGLLEVSLKYLWLMKCLLLCVHVVLKTLYLKFSRCCFTDYVKEMCKSACRTCSNIIFASFH